MSNNNVTQPRAALPSVHEEEAIITWRKRKALPWCIMIHENNIFDGFPRRLECLQAKFSAQLSFRAFLHQIHVYHTMSFLRRLQYTMPPTKCISCARKVYVCRRKYIRCAKCYGGSKYIICAVQRSHQSK